MRKKTISHLADTIFWYALYFLPVVCFLLVYYRVGHNVSLIDFMSDGGFFLATDNIIFDVFVQIFGSNGILPLFANEGILAVLSWFVCVYILHLLADFMLFIPRLLHKWMKGCYQDDK